MAAILFKIPESGLDVFIFLGLGLGLLTIPAHGFCAVTVGFMRNLTEFVDLTILCGFHLFFMYFRSKSQKL